MDNEFLLQDRLQKIRQIIRKYGEENFYLSYSGGKDSTVLSALIDMALPNNKIPRVYANTGIEYRLILDFVERERERQHNWELVILKPSKPIKPMLEEVGYPFKSKVHSMLVGIYQRSGLTEGVTNYLGTTTPKSGIRKFSEHICPKILRYQFTDEFKLKLSKKCCDELKKKPLHKWQKENNKPFAIIGIMASEGGERMSAHCLRFKNEKFSAFQPLVPVTKEWEDWFIEKYNIEISDIYKPPYNFLRTGCKGCPFALKLQDELDVLEKFFPAERKQCEFIWQPVYEEYRRLGYRLRKGGKQVTIDDYLWDLEHDEQRKS
jgi:3'-phosphoadenosine 5'-phosphosulfate sulfotransferase (PAPS reductase)/FAD synthetase